LSKILAEGYLRQYLNKPWVDKPLSDYTRMMDGLPASERKKILSDKTIRGLIKRVNSTK